MLVETQRSILDRAQLLLLIVIILGPYEAATFFYAIQVLVLTLPLTSHPLILTLTSHAHPHPHPQPQLDGQSGGSLIWLLVIRYVVLTTLLLALIAYMRSNPSTTTADNKVYASLVICLPSVALIGIALVAGVSDVAIPCPAVDALPCNDHTTCDDAPWPPPLGPTPPLPPPLVAQPAPYEQPSPPYPPPFHLPSGSNVTGGYSYAYLCCAGWVGDVKYCYSPPFDYFALIGTVHAIYHYSVELGAGFHRHTLMTLAITFSLVYIGVFALRLAFSPRFTNILSDAFMRGAAPQLAVSSLWIAVSHAIGLIHYSSRRAR